MQAGPNVLILLSDDAGWGDASPPLGVSRALTPELNAMAVSPGAAHFPRSYIGGSVCSPSRASILTGRSPSRDCVINVEQFALPAALKGDTLADLAQSKGYRTAFFGKYHLGSNTDIVNATYCYDPALTNGTCLPGYVKMSPATCCDGRDAHVPARPPTFFGFDTVMSTSQVAPSSTSNCGCLMTVPGAGVGCNLGHYDGAHTPLSVPGLECDQYWHTRPGDGVWAAYEEVSAVDDAAMLVDQLENFLLSAAQDDRPFVAQVSFHQTHIPYVAPPEFRALYPDATRNEQDYWGATSAMDAQVGRIRRMLLDLNVSTNTLVSWSADNGPENDAGDHSCDFFVNPGLTGGLQGRKRALLEGGVRVLGVVEAPWLVAQANNGAGGPLRLDNFAAGHIDYVPTLMDLIGASRAHSAWPIDGISLVPALTGKATTRPTAYPWLSDFALESGNATCPAGAARLPPSAPANFTTPANQPQVAWMEGPLKLVACRNPAPTSSWQFRLFDVDADPAEANDLFEARLAVADAMYVRLAAWLVSVQASRDAETNCTACPAC